MSDQQIRETLEKQLQLLSERSKACLSDSDLAEISEVMINLSSFLRSSFETSQN